MTFQGGCDQNVFNTWLKEVLIPQIPKGTTLVMDNASFHKGAQTKKLIEEAQCHLLFLPTYSPDLNPIENCWHVIKSHLKALLPTQKNLEILIGEIIIKTYQLN
jgi:transposase